MMIVYPLALLYCNEVTVTFLGAHVHRGACHTPIYIPEYSHPQYQGLVFIPTAAMYFLYVTRNSLKPKAVLFTLKKLDFFLNLFLIIFG